MMEQITLLTKADIREAVFEALSQMSQSTPTPEPEQYVYGLQGLADFLGVGITTAWKLKNSGKLNYYQTGKKIFFKKSEILAVLAK